MTPVLKLVIIPTFNEFENIGNIIDAVLALDDSFHVLVVDDSSTDGTKEIINDKIAGQHADRLNVIYRKEKLGLGTAYIAGFKWAIKRPYHFVFEMDADFSHDPKDLIRLLDKCESQNYDVAIGSRYCKGGGLKNWTWDRIVLSYLASLYVRLITSMPIKDPTAGFICYRTEVLKSIDLDAIRFIGYAFQIEMKYTAFRLGFKLAEVPIVFKDRELGTSKMSINIIEEAIIGVVQMRRRKVQPARSAAKDKKEATYNKG